MSAYLTDAAAFSRTFDPPPILIAADSDEAAARAARFVEAAGVRIADQVMLPGALERIRQQVVASAVWLELDRDGGEVMDGLLHELNAEARAGRFQLLVSAPIEVLDAVAATVDCDQAQLMIDGDEASRVSALAVALAGARRPARLSDVSSDRNALRLRQLSDEVSRIASALARLSAGPAAPSSIADPDRRRAEVPDVSVEAVRSVIRARRLRSRYFAEDLFADPAWDMLLDLLQAELAHLRVPVSSLCIAAAVPPTTALRWLKTMTDEGLFLRRADPHDGRRVFVELAPHASQALRRYFAEVGKPAVI